MDNLRSLSNEKNYLQLTSMNLLEVRDENKELEVVQIIGNSPIDEVMDYEKGDENNLGKRKIQIGTAADKKIKNEKNQFDLKQEKQRLVRVIIKKDEEGLVAILEETKPDDLVQLLNAKNWKGIGMLHMAVENCSEGFLKLMLDAYKKIDPSGYVQWLDSKDECLCLNAFHYAVQQDNLSALKFLIERYRQENETGVKGLFHSACGIMSEGSLLYYAAGCGKEDCLRFLISVYRQVDRGGLLSLLKIKSDLYGHTLLYEALEGSTNGLRLLLDTYKEACEEGVVQKENETQEEYIHRKAEAVKKELLAFLGYRDSYGRTALGCVVGLEDDSSYRNIAIDHLSYLLSTYREIDREGWVYTVQQDAPRFKNTRLLCEIVRDNAVDVFLYLLEVYRKDLLVYKYIESFRIKTLFQLIAEFGRYKYLKPLLDTYGENHLDLLNSVDRDGNTLLHYAARARNENCLKLLLDIYEKENKAGLLQWINAFNKDKENVFMVAIDYGQVRCMRWLLEKDFVGCVTSLNLYEIDHGMTILHRVAKGGYGDSLRVLLDIYKDRNPDALWNVSEGTKRTLLMDAIASGRVCTVKLLIDECVAIRENLLSWMEEKDVYSRTAFDIAVVSKNMECLEYLMPLYEKMYLLQYKNDETKIPFGWIEYKNKMIQNAFLIWLDSSEMSCGFEAWKCLIYLIDNGANISGFEKRLESIYIGLWRREIPAVFKERKESVGYFGYDYPFYQPMNMNYV